MFYDLLLPHIEINIQIEVRYNMQERTWLIELRDKGSQLEIAEAAGISQNFYSWIEKGKRTPRPDVAKKIAVVLKFEWTRFYETA